MSQHDLEITNADANTGITFRAAVNAALQALGSCQTGGTAPTTTYPSMLWADTTANLLKMRNVANTAWITIGTLDAANLGLAVAANVLPLAGGTLTGTLTLAGAGTAALHPATLAQIQAGAFLYAVDSGSADALVAAFTPAITVLTPGMILVIKTAAANTTTTPTLNVNGLGAATITRNSGVLWAGDIKANGYSLFQYYETGGTGYYNLLNPILTGTVDLAAGAVTTAKLAAGAVTSEKVADGAVVQVQTYQTGAVATGTTAIPNDDTIPQNTEGDEYMTLAITPKATTNILLIECTFNWAHTNGGVVGIGLFQDSTADALAAWQTLNESSVNNMRLESFRHKMVAGTVSATTFKIRAGHASGATLTFNGVSGARKLGGVAASSITITEVKA